MHDKLWQRIAQNGSNDEKLSQSNVWWELAGEWRSVVLKDFSRSIAEVLERVDSKKCHFSLATLSGFYAKRVMRLVEEPNDLSCDVLSSSFLMIHDPS